MIFFRYTCIYNPYIVLFIFLGFYIINFLQAYVFFCAQDEIDSVLVLGGGFRVPKVQEILLEAVKK
jgi:hypothetical protein